MNCLQMRGQSWAWYMYMQLRSYSWFSGVGEGALAGHEDFRGALETHFFLSIQNVEGAPGEVAGRVGHMYDHLSPQ